MNNNTTRKFIIDTANMLFSEKGYNNVTVNDICEACNITKTTFYYHLSSKEDIILDFYSELAQKMRLNFSSILSENSPWKQFIMCYEMILDESVNYGVDILSQMFISNLKSDSGSFDFRESITNIMVTLINKAKKAGEILNPMDTETLYRASAYAFSGIEVLWCIKDGNLDWKRELTKSLEAIFNVSPELRTSDK